MAKGGWVGLLVIALGAAIAAVYVMTKPTDPITGDLGGPAMDTYIDGPPAPLSADEVASGGPSGDLPPAIVQEDPHYGAPSAPAEEYAVLAEMERADKMVCPWDNMIFTSLAGCFHHILNSHGGARGPNGEVLEGQVPLLRYQKIPLLVRVVDPEGNPVVGQLVEIKTRLGGVMKAAYTDGNGGVDFTGMEEGEIRIAIDGLPAYSQYDYLYDLRFLYETGTLYNFSGEPVVTQFVKPYVVSVNLTAPGWSVIDEITDTPPVVATEPPATYVPPDAGQNLPAPSPTMATVESITIVDALLAAQAGRAGLADKIALHDGGVTQIFTNTELLLILSARG